MDRKGQMMLTILLIVGLVVVASGIGFMAYKVSKDDSSDGSPIVDDTTSCEIAPAIDIVATDEINKGTSVSGTTQTFIVDGQLRGSTPTLKVGESGNVLVAKTNYIDELIPFSVTSCGNESLPVGLYATSTNTFRAFNSDGNPLTDNANANQTAGNTVQTPSAAPINIELKIDSTSDESTGDLIIVVEVDNTTEVDSIKLSGAGASDATTPEFYSPVAAGSNVDTFRVPALLDGESKSLTLNLAPESGETIGASGLSVYVTAYSEQAFVDTDGTGTVGVEDMDGNTKYEDTWDFDFCVITSGAC